jgi:hypothetical protein
MPNGETETVTVKLPSGTYDLIVPKGANAEQVRQLLQEKQPELLGNPKTGEGMQAVGAAKAHNETAGTYLRPNNLMNVATGPPLTSMQPGLPSPAQDPTIANTESVLSSIFSLPEGIAAMGPVRMSKSLLGMGGGAYLGGPAGHYVGNLFGHPEAGEKVGTALGGLAGGIWGGAGGRVPGRGSLIRDLVFGEPKPVDPRVAELREASIARRYAALKAGQQPETAMTVPGSSAIDVNPVEGRVAGTRSLILSPEEAQSESQIQNMAKQRASQRGMQFAAGMTPREGRSVPRYSQAMPMTEPPGPKSVTKFDEEGNPIGEDQ